MNGRVSIHSVAPRPITSAVCLSLALMGVLVIATGCGPDVSGDVRLGDDRVAAYDWPGAIEAFTEAIERDPNAVDAYAGRCNALRLSRELDRALVDCNRAIDLGGGVAGYVNRGNVYDDLGEFELALADYDRAIEIDPGATTAYRNRGVAYHLHGGSELALADYDRAIELDPNYAKAYTGRGGLYHELGELDAAQEDFGRALELDPSDPDAYLARGVLHASRGNPASALTDYDAAIELYPAYAGAHSSRALALIETGDYAAAIDDAERAISLRPELASGHYSRGLARAYLGLDDRAIADYDRAIVLDPDYFDAISARARAHIRQGDAKAALSDTQRLVDLAPDGAVLYAFRAVAKAMGGDTSGAVDDFDQALTMTADPEEIDAILELKAEAVPREEPQRIDRSDAGFSITLPSAWEYAYAGEVDPDYWYEAEVVGDVKSWYEERLDDGLLLESRGPALSATTAQWCDLFDITELAVLSPPWLDLEDAERSHQEWYAGDPANSGVETAYLEFPQGRMLSIDSRWEGDMDVREYFFTDGERWLRLGCSTNGVVADDRWQSIAESLELLPKGEVE